jgi:predicted membrane-bound mannosyltransferase
MEKMARFILSKTSGNSWIIGILLLAAFLRLYRIQDYMTFLGDEGRDVLVAYNILHGNLTLLGPTASVGGFFLGPIYYYFMAPFLLAFNYNPVGPAIMVALFGIATVFLIYKVGVEFFGKGVGLIAAFLYSISPLVIAYSRSSWNPNLMPFFSLLSLYVLYKAVAENKIKLFILCGFLLGIAMQLHYLAIFLGMIIAIYVLLIRAYSFFGRHSGDPPAGGDSRISNGGWRFWTSQNDASIFQKTISVVILASSIGIFVNAFFINSLFYPSIMVWMWILIGFKESR